MQLATTRHHEGVGIFGELHPQRHVGLQFALQAFADLAAGHVLALAAGQRRGVDQKFHGQRRLVDAQQRQRVGVAHLAERGADVDVLDAVDGHDVTGLGKGHHLAFQPPEAQHLVDLRGNGGFFVAMHQQHGLAATDGAAVDAADADPAHVAGIVQRRDLELQRTVRVVGTGRHAVEDRLEERRHRRVFGGGGRFGLFHFVHGIAGQRRGIHHREVQLLLGSAQPVEQVEGLVHHPVRAGAGTVDLVHHHDGAQAQRQRLAGDEAGLRHGAIHGVHQQQHAVHHRQGPLHLATEVGVSRGIDDVDPCALVLDGTVLGQNGDAALALQIVGVHHALVHLLVGPEGTGLAQQLVHQRGLAVVHVRDDRDVADRLG